MTYNEGEKEIKFSEIPNLPGVYILKDKEGTILYVGKAKNLAKRISYYFQGRIDSPRLESLKRKIRKIEIYVTDNEYEALELEANLVANYEPKYNVELKDDKHYPYIKITNEPYPRVLVVRSRKNDGATYFGPFTDVGSMRQTLRFARTLFGIRDCKLKLPAKNVKPCLNFQINRCLGPCAGAITREKYADAVEKMKKFLSGKRRALLAQLRREMQRLAKDERFEQAALIRDKIFALEKFFGQKPIEMPDLVDRDFIALAFRRDEGVAVIFQAREGSIIGRNVQLFSPGSETDLEAIYKGFLIQYYKNNSNIPQEIVIPVSLEDGKKISDLFSKRFGKKCKVVQVKAGTKLKIMRLVEQNAELILNERVSSKYGIKLSHETLLLQKELNLDKPPRWIEAIDISNIQGKWATGSLVVFVDGKPQKSEYRRFKIAVSGKADDYSMIKEVIYRHYRRLIDEKKNLPDLILVDGGIGQLNSAVEVLKTLGIDKDVNIVALAKKLEEVYLPGASSPITIPRYSLALKLLQKIRNEAHRFALSYHKKIRSSSLEAKILDQVPGIGKTYQKRLLEAFNSIEEIAQAKPEDISTKAKLPLKLAKRLVEFLSQDNILFYL